MNGHNLFKTFMYCLFCCFQRERGTYWWTHWWLTGSTWFERSRCTSEKSRSLYTREWTFLFYYSLCGCFVKCVFIYLWCKITSYIEILVRGRIQTSTLSNEMHRCNFHDKWVLRLFACNQWSVCPEPGRRSWSSSSQVWRGNFAGWWRRQVRQPRFQLQLFNFPFFHHWTLKSNSRVTDHLKSREERQRETMLMQMLMEIVNGRNAIVEGLDEDRLRWRDASCNWLIRESSLMRSNAVYILQSESDRFFFIFDEFQGSGGGSAVEWNDEKSW